MGITEATKEGDAESNMMVDRDEDYNTRYGGYKGNLLAWERTKIIPRRPAAIDLTSMIAGLPAPTRSTRSSITSFTAFCPCRWRTRTAPLLIDFLRGKLGTSASSRARSWKNRSGSALSAC